MRSCLGNLGDLRPDFKYGLSMGWTVIEKAFNSVNRVKKKRVKWKTHA